LTYRVTIVQSVCAVKLRNAVHNSTIHITTCVSDSRSAGEKNESYITKHGDQQSEKGPDRYAARWILQITGYVSARLNSGDRWEKDSKHREESLIVLLRVPIIRSEITRKYVR